MWEDSHRAGVAPLLAGLDIKKDTGRVHYAFAFPLMQKLLDNKIFTRLRVHFIIGLSGKYTVALYMLLEGLANLRQPTLTIPLDELRDRLNVPEGKLSDWRDFNKFALAPAIKQINEAEDGGFVADYRTESQGRKIIAVTFTVVKTVERTDKEKNLSRKIGKQQATKSAAQIPPFSSDNYETLKRLNTTRLDIYQYESSWRDWCAKETEKTGKPTTSPIGSFISYLVRQENRELKKSY
jgi:plasmid replication initiation protein